MADRVRESLAHARRPASVPAMPRVAVLIPVFGNDGRLAATLRSLVGQTVPLIAVVVDDGSTPPVAVDAAAYPFGIVLLRQRRHVGIERALNAGLRHIRARGIPYVARLDNGDRCAEGRLAAQLAFLDAHPDVALVGSAVEWRDDEGRLRFARHYPTRHGAIVRALHHSVPLVHPAVMFRRAVVESLGGYSTSYPAAEDYDLFWRVARVARVANLPEILLTTRFDPQGVSARRRRRQLLSTLRLRLAHFSPQRAESWFGIAKTVVLLGLPYDWIVRIKHARTVMTSDIREVAP